jgi:uncharacterized membrane protein HdeD (DUF308 family)
MARLRDQADDENRGWLLLAGSLMFVFAGLAVMGPILAAIAIDRNAGELVLLGGLFGLGFMVIAPQADTGAWWWNLAGPVLAAIAGGLLLWQPGLEAISVALVLAGYLTACGVAKLVNALLYRSRVGNLAPWLAGAGILDLAIAAMVL